MIKSATTSTFSAEMALEHKKIKTSCSRSRLSTLEKNGYTKNKNIITAVD